MKTVLSSAIALSLAFTVPNPVYADLKDALIGGVIGAAINQGVRNNQAKKKTGTVRRTTSTTKKRASVPASLNSKFSRDERRLIQTSPNNMGLNVGVVDGSLGGKSRVAISQFQAQRGEAVTGQMTRPQFLALTGAGFGAAAPVLANRQLNSNEVVMLQQSLQRLGFYRGTIDGINGASKLASDKMFVSGNAYAGEHGTKFSVVRYGNVMGSRGSVIPFFLSIKDGGVLPITDPEMTRFMISLEEGVDLVWHAFEDMEGGEIYVKKIPSMKVTDVARVIAPDARQDIVGVRPGEKLHEQMVGVEDAHHTFEYPEHYKILPATIEQSDYDKRIKDGVRVAKDFLYASDSNSEWMSDDDLAEWIKRNETKIGAT